MVHHREEPLSCALELLHLLEQSGTLLVMTRVLDRCGGLGGEQSRDVLILVRERRSHLFFSVTYRFPNTPRLPTIGTPRNERIGG